jgi:hypothetical protein
VLVENVRFLAGYRRSGVVDETPLEHAFARVVDGAARCRSALSFGRGRRDCGG